MQKFLSCGPMKNILHSTAALYCTLLFLHLLQLYASYMVICLYYSSHIRLGTTLFRLYYWLQTTTQFPLPIYLLCLDLECDLSTQSWHWTLYPRAFDMWLVSMATTIWQWRGGWSWPWPVTSGKRGYSGRRQSLLSLYSVTSLWTSISMATN